MRILTEMALDFSDERKTGGEDSGRDSLNFKPDIHHVSKVDTPSSGPSGAVEAHKEAQNIEEVDSKKSHLARQGALWASENMKGDGLPFRESNGIFTSGRDVGSLFDQAIRDSGGVRQSSTWTSDPAPGIHRSVVEHKLSLDALSKPDEGAGLQDQGEGVVPIGKRPAS